jgi:VWFA-related protein
MSMKMVAAVLAVVLGVSAPVAQQSATPAQRPPVFRAGAHYVRVDAYPTRDGRIIEGLTKDDFEIFEDGTPQAIENAEYITFDTWTPDAERKDPSTQEESFELAADARYRVFVVVIDRAAYDMRGSYVMRQPLHEFLDRNLGPHDLFGLLSSESEWTDLVLGQKTLAAGAEIDSRRWMQSDEFNERLQPYYLCGLSSLIPRKKADDTYTLLEGLVRLLGLIREERKSIVFVANGLMQDGPSAVPPGGGVHSIPRIGIENGRIGPVRRGYTGVSESFCALERSRLANLDFAARFRELLAAARQANVAFYPVAPVGLQTFPFTERGGVDMDEYRRQQERTGALQTLASQTDGVAIVNTNDLRGGMRRIADDLQAYYVLGYYTTNTKWDGRVRSIKVRLKPKRDPSTGLGAGTIRARRQYRAPTEAEVAALSASSSPRAPVTPSAEDEAFALLARARSSSPFVAYAASAGPDVTLVLEAMEDATGARRLPAGADVQAIAETADGVDIGSARTRFDPAARGALVRLPLQSRQRAASAIVRIRGDGMVFTDRVIVPHATALAGDAVAYRNGAPAALLTCARSDRLRFEWPILAPVETLDARLLDRRGQPLAVRLPVVQSGSDDKRIAAVELALASLGRGDYLVELTVRAHGVTERKLMALRVT